MGWSTWNGDQLIELTNRAACEAVKKTGNVVLTVAKQEVPLDESPLMRSGIVIMAGNNIPACCITFGGGAGTGYPIIPYALRWHENQARHFQHGRKRFYLRDPFNRLARNTLERALEQECRGFM